MRAVSRASPGFSEVCLNSRGFGSPRGLCTGGAQLPPTGQSHSVPLLPNLVTCLLCLHVCLDVRRLWGSETKPREVPLPSLMATRLRGTGWLQLLAALCQESDGSQFL